MSFVYYVENTLAQRFSSIRIDRIRTVHFRTFVPMRPNSYSYSEWLRLWIGHVAAYIVCKFQLHLRCPESGLNMGCLDWHPQDHRHYAKSNHDSLPSQIVTTHSTAMNGTAVTCTRFISRCHTWHASISELRVSSYLRNTYLSTFLAWKVGGPLTISGPPTMKSGRATGPPVPPVPTPMEADEEEEALYEPTVVKFLKTCRTTI